MTASFYCFPPPNCFLSSPGGDRSTPRIWSGRVPPRERNIYQLRFSVFHFPVHLGRVASLFAAKARSFWLILFVDVMLFPSHSRSMRKLCLLAARMCQTLPSVHDSDSSFDYLNIKNDACVSC